MTNEDYVPMRCLDWEMYDKARIEADIFARPVEPEIVLYLMDMIDELHHDRCETQQVADDNDNRFDTLKREVSEASAYLCLCKHDKEDLWEQFVEPAHAQLCEALKTAEGGAS